MSTISAPSAASKTSWIARFLLFGGVVLLGVWFFAGRTQDGEAAERTHVHLNQVGFYPGGPKLVAVTGAPARGPFYVIAREGGDTLQTGTLGDLRDAPLAGDRVRLADISALESPGRYVVDVPGIGRSDPFNIEPRVHRTVAQAALKGFYYQRASVALPEAYAGDWHRAAGHPDTSVRVHPSAATEARSAGTHLSAPKGWYDAGDYNKYIVNSGISTATLLSLYEDFPAFADSIRVDIPERENDRPDVLDEALWNLRWMLQMQDPNDGGVYHKLTAANFEGMNVMPANAAAPRFVVQKSTAATLDFAAVMAQASRIFRDFNASQPGLSDTLATAARNAWRWAQHHPEVVYDQERLNQRYDPDIRTGTYGDRHLRDEFFWAAAELYATTGGEKYAEAVEKYFHGSATVPSWGQVRTLGYFTLARELAGATGRDGDLHNRVRELLLEKARSLAANADTSAFGTPMGQTARDFVWGSNGVAANQGIALVWAYRLTDDRKYLRAALANLDYLLGRNPTGYSFVTGVGDKTPRHPHHRPSVADDVPAPVPGLLVGGPNPGQQDGCDYPSDQPALSYVDDACSYASNEIAINWNAPLVYLAAALEALQDEAGYVSQ